MGTDENMEEESAIISLKDENGNELEFEVADFLTYKDEDYVVLIPVEDFDGEVVIFKVSDCEDDPESEVYEGVEDELLLETIFELFKERNKDLLDFED